MIKKNVYAPGWPGIAAHWTTGAKTGVGTAINETSAVWFTVSEGILNEIYYPRVDHACTRDMQFIVTNGKDFFSEEKKDTIHNLEFIEEGVPAYKLTNTCMQDQYKIEKEIVTDPHRNCVLQHVKFTALKKRKNFKLYILLAPHIGNHGAGNNAWLGDYKGVQMLFAERDGVSLALACSASFKQASVGYVGKSDGWQDLRMHNAMTWHFEKADNGNVALTAEIDLDGVTDGEFTLSLGFGRRAIDAAQRAKASLVQGFSEAKKIYIKEWKEWQSQLASFKPSKKAIAARNNLYRISTLVMRTHGAKRLPGGFIASLSIPWGFSKGDDDLGGYHLVWPRDLVQTAGGLLAAKAIDEVRQILNYLMVTQEEDGHWNQNMWLDGTSYWSGIQMDETSFPVLLVDLVRRKGALDEADIKRFWPMIKKAAGYIVANGPVTEQDRWEENAGYSAFTLAVEISALLCAADIADLNNEKATANFLRETADNWNSNIERWIYVQNTELCEKHKVDGYYIRIAPTTGLPNAEGSLFVKNQPADESEKQANLVVSPDVLALVRFGLRSAHDPRIVNSVKVIDGELLVETPCGPCWYRYNYDGYGEHDNGDPYNGTGKGRLWPLLTGERAHYEIAAGNIEKAKDYLSAIEAFANEGGMLPEQVWDTHDIPEKGLYFGRPSGSAMPLVWAHSEYVTLCRSINEEKIFDMPSQTAERYIKNKTGSSIDIWAFNNQITNVKPGNKLRIHTIVPSLISWTTDNFDTASEAPSFDSKLGVYYFDIDTKNMKENTKIGFTFYWPESQNWEGVNYEVNVSATEVISTEKKVQKKMKSK
jgi:glucoamylase